MKILVIVDDYLPESKKIAGKMMHELSAEFVKQGHEVTVVTPSSLIKDYYTLKKLDNVNIIKFNSKPIKNVSKVKRAIRETLLSYNAWKYTKDYFKKNPHNYIIYYSPSIFWGSFVLKLKKMWNAKTYLVLRDIFPQWVIDNKILKKHSLITYYFKFFEYINYKPADTIGLMSLKNLEWFNSYCYSNKNLEILYNWTTVNNNIPYSNKYRKKFNLEDKIIFFYGGNIGTAQDMLNIVRLAKNLKNEKSVHFLLVGSGDEYELVEKAILDNALTNISIFPSVEQSEFQVILSEIDVGLFSLNKDHKTHNFPGKLLGYMQHSLPILGSINKGNDLKEMIEENNAGYISINGDDETLLKNAYLLLDERVRKNKGRNSYKLLEDVFSVKTATEKILNTFSS